MDFLATVALLLAGWFLLKLVVLKAFVRHTPPKVYLWKNFFFYDERERVFIACVEFVTLLLAAPIALFLFTAVTGRN